LIIENAHAGRPFYILRNGKVIAMPMEELKTEAARLQAE
jgi:hypothetical protein